MGDTAVMRTSHEPTASLAVDILRTEGIGAVKVAFPLKSPEEEYTIEVRVPVEDHGRALVLLDEYLGGGYGP